MYRLRASVHEKQSPDMASMLLAVGRPSTRLAGKLGELNRGCYGRADVSTTSVEQKCTLDTEVECLAFLPSSVCRRRAGASVIPHQSLILIEHDADNRFTRTKKKGPKNVP